MMYGKLLFRMLVAVVVLSVGCRAAELAVPADLGSKTRTFAVQGRMGFNLFDERFSFGPYRVLAVDRGWTETTTIGIFSVADTEAEQQFSYSMQTPSGQWQARCAADVHRLGWDMDRPRDGYEINIDLTGRESLACELLPPGGRAPLLLGMTGRGADRAMVGNIVVSGMRIDIMGSHDLAGSDIDLSDPAGYYFRLLGGNIGALDVINQGRVILPSGSNAQYADTLAVASAALLLRQDLIH